MIPNFFEYYRPDTIQEALEIYDKLSIENKKPHYYAGGSEIITMARANSIDVGSVIDLKAIPKMQELKIENDKLIIGACVTLSRIEESKLFKLLGLTVGRIADHTNQNRITIGGNVCGTIIYKESVMPLLLADALVTIASKNGERQENINNIFNERININAGEIIVNFIIDLKYTNMPYVHVKKTQNEKIDYPVLTLTALKDNDIIKMAFSGLCNFPFRSKKIEDIVNNSRIIYSRKNKSNSK